MQAGRLSRRGEVTGTKNMDGPESVEATVLEGEEKLAALKIAEDYMNNSSNSQVRNECGRRFQGGRGGYMGKRRRVCHY